MEKKTHPFHKKKAENYTQKNLPSKTQSSACILGESYFDTYPIFMDLQKPGQLSKFISYKVLLCSPYDTEFIKFSCALPLHQVKPKTLVFPPLPLPKPEILIPSKMYGYGCRAMLGKNIFIILVIFKVALIDLIYKRFTWI